MRKQPIAPLPAGMEDAVTASLGRQGYKQPVQEEPVVEPQTEPDTLEESATARPADKSKSDGDSKAQKVADITPETGMITGNDKAMKSVKTAIAASSNSQEMKASYKAEAKEEEVEKECDCEGEEDCDCDEIKEATIKVSSFTGKAPSGIKMKKLGSSSMGGDDVEMSGPDAKLIAYAKKSLGCDASCKTIADVQKSLKEIYEKTCASEALDDVDQKAVKKKFMDRKDKDLDNDGDEDESDKYLHRRRKAIAKALED